MFAPAPPRAARADRDGELYVPRNGAVFFPVATGIRRYARTVTDFASAPVEQRSDVARINASGWRVLVALSLFVVLAVAGAFAVAWVATSETHTDAYSVPGPVMGVQLRVVDGDVVLLGNAQDRVSVKRVERSSFGHGPVEWRSLASGRLTISSACPDLVVGTCRARYELAVPENVPVSVRADRGSIRVAGYNGSASLVTGDGSITVGEFCGHTLRAISTRGRIAASASCSPERLELRSGSGDVAATVPSGRYRVEAASGTGAALVRGVEVDAGAPWEIQALSTSGDVTVGAGS